MSDYLDGWLAGKRNLKASTRSSYLHAFKPVRRRIGRHKLEHVRKVDVDAVVIDMTEAGRSARTVVHTLTVLSQAFEAAVRQGSLGRNVVAMVERPRETKQQIERLDRRRGAPVPCARPWGPAARGVAAVAVRAKAR